MDGGSWNPGGKAAFIFGAGSGTQAQAPDSQLRIQTAVLGQPRPIGWGQSRLAGNLIWYGDFLAIPQSTGGKGLGGGGKGQTSGYNYQAAVIIAIGEGPISSFGRVWDQSGTVHVLSDYNLSTQLGSYTQTAYGYMTSNHPDQALNYRGLANAAAFPMGLGSNASLPGLNFEITWGINSAYPGVPDADPADIITDFLSNVHYGLGFPSGNIGDLTPYSNWCVSTGMVASDALTQRRAANDYLQDMAQGTDSEFVWSSRKLILVPYGDVTVTGNGATFVPDLTPKYTLTDADYMKNVGGSSIGVSSYTSDDPVICVRSEQASVINDYLVEYLDRTNNYNPTIAEAKNDAAIQFDILRPSDTKTWHFFCLQAAAITSAHLQLGRAQVRNQHTFTVDQRFIRTDPMDIIAINDSGLGLVNWPVRVKEITENQQDQSLTFIVEDLMPGSGTPYGYSSETMCCDRAPFNFTADPGPTVFAAFDANLCTVSDGPAIIVAAAGAGVVAQPRLGETGLISDWYEPGGSASGAQVLWESLTNDANGDYVKLIATVTGSNVVFSLEISATDSGGTPHAFSVSSGSLSVPAGGFGVLASWDLSTATWAAHIEANAGTAASATQAASGPINVAFPLLQSSAAGGTYQVGTNGAGGAMKWAHLWIGVDDDITALDLTLPTALHNQFFGVQGGGVNAPSNLNKDGSSVTGCPPTFYFAEAPGTGTTAGTSTGCLAGGVLPDTLGAGSESGIGSGTIPADGSYQAIGVGFSANFALTGPQPFGGMSNIWGGAQLWLSTDGGSTYNPVPTVIPGPSPIGKLTSNYPMGADPDTTDTLAVDLTESLGALAAYASSDADAGRSRCAIISSGGVEIIDYSAVSLTSAYHYSMGTYVRRGRSGTASAAHVIGDTFVQIGANAIVVPYPASLIGSTIHAKFLAANSGGGGRQDLANVPAYPIVLAGPGDPAAPASLAATQSAAGQPVLLSWPASTGCGVDSYALQYGTGGPTTTVELGNQLSTVLQLAPGAYTFEVFAVNSAGLISATGATATLTVS